MPRSVISSTSSMITSRGRRHSGTPVHITPPGTGIALVDGDLVALAGELAGGGQAVDAGADDGGGQPVRRRRNLAPGLAAVVGGDPLQVADADRGVDLLAAAGVLAGAGAHPAEAAGEDVVLAVELEASRRSARRRSARCSARCRCATGRRSCRGCCRRTTAGRRCRSGSACRSGSVKGREERGIDEGEQADPPGVLDIDRRSPGRRCRRLASSPVAMPTSAASIGRKRSAGAPQEGHSSGGAAPSWIQPQTLQRNMMW